MTYTWHAHDIHRHMSYTNTCHTQTYNIHMTYTDTWNTEAHDRHMTYTDTCHTHDIHITYTGTWQTHDIHRHRAVIKTHEINKLMLHRHMTYIHRHLFRNCYNLLWLSVHVWSLANTFIWDWLLYSFYFVMQYDAVTCEKKKLGNIPLPLACLFQHDFEIQNKFFKC